MPVEALYLRVHFRFYSVQWICDKNPVLTFLSICSEGQQPSVSSVPGGDTGGDTSGIGWSGEHTWHHCTLIPRTALYGHLHFYELFICINFCNNIYELVC